MKAVMLWAVFLALVPSAVVGRRACGEKLSWQVETYQSASQGWDLQLCCDVEAVWAAAVGPNWSLDLPAAVPTLSVANLSLPGSEFVVSACSDGSVSQGYVPQRPGLTCRYERGSILRLLPAGQLQGQIINSHGLTSNRWYVLCYDRSPKTGSCRSCALQRLCSSLWHPNCTDAWFQRTAFNVQNDSLSLRILAGTKMPFSGRLELAVHAQNANATRVFAHSIPRISPGANYTVPEVSGLRPDSWYRVTACLHFTLPDAFQDAHPDVLLPVNHVRCLPDESYRTLSTHSFSSAPDSLCPSFLVLFMLSYLIGATLSRSPSS